MDMLHKTEIMAILW